MARRGILSHSFRELIWLFVWRMRVRESSFEGAEWDENVHLESRAKLRLQQGNINVARARSERK